MDSSKITILYMQNESVVMMHQPPVSTLQLPKEGDYVEIQSVVFRVSSRIYVPEAHTWKILLDFI